MNWIIKGLRPPVPQDLQPGDWNRSLRVISTSGVNKNLSYKLLDFGCFFCFHQATEGEKRKQKGDFDWSGKYGCGWSQEEYIREVTDGLDYGQHIENIGFHCGCKAQLTILSLLSGTACAFFSKKGCSQITIELWAYWFHNSQLAFALSNSSVKDPSLPEFHIIT